ncbi:patatin-like phospholipase family protein [Mycoplasmatota bacterium WC44]
MNENTIKNLVFEGGGVLGIAYLGVIDYLSSNKLLQNVKRVAGTSAGAITACITSLGLPFDKIKDIADTLDYKKVPEKIEHQDLNKIPPFIKNEIEKIFGDIDCIYRLIKDYGWYSSEYFYNWIKDHIEAEFDHSKKLPPYTFEDFMNTDIHKNQRPFLDLYITGTDISTNSSMLFSYETTPHMEVAEAVRISMSIPLFFESVKVDEFMKSKRMSHIYSDGGVMRNFPINLFDSRFFKDKIVDGVNIQTLGARFRCKYRYDEINNIVEYIENLVKSLIRVQDDIFNNRPKDILRSIQIDTDLISSTDFNITKNDDKYNFLYQQGYDATKKYFEDKLNLSIT